MTKIFWNKAGTWGTDQGRILPINRPGGGLVTSKEVLDLSKEEATYRSGLRGFRRSELPGADLSIHRRGAYFRIEWILEGREAGWGQLEARQSIAMLLLRSPKGVPAPWMALETWCRHTGAPGLEDRGGEVKRRVEAYLLAFIERWESHPEQQPVLSSIAAWPAAFVQGDGGRLDLRASAVNLGIQANWSREESGPASNPMERAIADMRSEFAFWAGPFAQDRSLKWVQLPTDWAAKAEGWLECTSIDLQGEWGIPYYQGLSLRLEINRAIARQMTDYLAEQGREDVDTEFLRAMGKGNPSQAQRAAWADQVIAFASDREAWMQEQARLSATKERRDETYIPKWRRRQLEAAEAHRQFKATADTLHLRVDDDDARRALADLGWAWGEGDPWVAGCKAELEAGSLDRASEAWRALYNQHLHRSKLFSAFSAEGCIIPGQREALEARIHEAIARLGYFAAKDEVGSEFFDEALGDPEAEKRALDALVGTDQDLGAWSGKTRWTKAPRRWVDTRTNSGRYSRVEPDGPWVKSHSHEPRLVAWLLSIGSTPVDPIANQLAQGFGRAI